MRKRDGATIESFNAHKIAKAITGAWIDCRGEATLDRSIIDRVTDHVTAVLPMAAPIDVERIQDAVEVALMHLGHFDVAKAFIVFRDERAKARAVRKAADPNAIADYTTLAKYARYRPDLKRRETFDEIVDRVEGMHTKRFPQLRAELAWAFNLVRQKHVLPSMRTMQYAGAAIEQVNVRAFNCCASLVDRPRVFGEVLYLLLAGAGVGFSVQHEHVAKLPPLKVVNTDDVVHHTVGDSIEGWADALNELVQSHIHGYYVEFNYSKVRPRGTPLKTSGGKAPGHLGLKAALEAIRGVLNGAAGRKLRPIECYDILCLAAEAVLSGGNRRSASICLFSIDDAEMLAAKIGDWWKTHPWRKNSNNSAVLLRHDVSERQFRRIFDLAREWGEPGFILSDDADYLFNPCAEAALSATLVVTEESRAEVVRRLGRDVKVGEKLTGFGFCNLTTINAAACATVEEFQEAAKAAAIIGTVQASYTNASYLGPVTEMIMERDALLGVSMTGMLDNPTIALDPKIQRETAAMIVSWNKEIAARIGINSAARTTCIKPEGTGSLVLRAVASGHHAHHARRYFRRVTAKNNEPVFQHFQTKNPHMCVPIDEKTYLIEFLIEAPEGAVLKEDLGAIEFLEMARSTQQNWVLPGTARAVDSPGLNHNVSLTAHVKDDEWLPVAAYLWQKRADFTAVSLLPATADKRYKNAPYEAVTTPADEARWNEIAAKYVAVDYTEMVEEADETDLANEAACAGGACSL